MLDKAVALSVDVQDSIYGILDLVSYESINPGELFGRRGRTRQQAAARCMQHCDQGANRGGRCSDVLQCRVLHFPPSLPSCQYPHDILCSPTPTRTPPCPVVYEEVKSFGCCTALDLVGGLWVGLVIMGSCSLMQCLLSLRMIAALDRLPAKGWVGGAVRRGGGCCMHVLD